MGDISTTGPMGRYAEDLDLLLSIIAGPDVEDPFVHPLASAGAPVDLRQVKVGVLPSLPGCTQGTAAAIAAAAEALSANGATVVELEPWSTEEAVELAFALMAPDGGARARRNLEPADGRHTEEFADLLRALEQGRMNIDEYLRTLDKLAVYRSRIRRSVAAVDVALVPVAAGPAPLHDRLPGDDQAEYNVDGFAHGFAIALAGLPSAVVPVEMEGPVPVGVQMVGSAHQDFRILELASAVQRARQEAIPPPTAWMG